MRFIGIDPGEGGGVAWITENHIIGNSVFETYAEARKFPETERDLWLLLAELETGSDFALIERVHSMPKQGVASSFKFGQSYGFLRGCLIASGIPFEEVTPHKWQKSLRCLTGGNKNVSKAKAQQLFPHLKITHATADALLIAEHCRQSRTPTPTT